MVDPEHASDGGGGGSGGPRKRTSTACEACRSSKLRCLPSTQPGVCKKCLESKKECVSRTGPRVRRSKKAILAQAQAQAQSQSQSPAPAAVSSTFTIDFAIPAEPELDEDFAVLRDTHDAIIDDLFPEDADADIERLSTCPSSTSASASIRTPASTANSHSMDDLHAKPQFNRASAESLLETFRAMLTHCPCVVLAPGDTVSHLAATRPFVLLAILCAASGSKTLRGHALYDEEFRKVLGLKFVAGGERTLELLQGIIIYCSWFPFHLRPKNKQVFHYVRMAADLIHDLDLDQENGPCKFTGFADETQVECLRTYLSFQYLVTIALFTPSPYKGLLTCTFTPWTTACCDMLDSLSGVASDKVLTTLLRLASVTGTAWESVLEAPSRSSEQGRLAMLGLDTHFRTLKSGTPPEVAALVPVQLALLATEITLMGGAAVVRTSRLPKGIRPLPPDHTKLYACCQLVKEELELLSSLDKPTFSSFTCMDWTKFVAAIVIAIRLSFPLAEYPAWDAAWAREHMGFGAFLERMCDRRELADAARQMDVQSATRVVLSVVRDKYERRLARLRAAEEFTTGMSSIGGCPMLDGSLAQLMPEWDPQITLNPMANAAAARGEGPQQIFHDLWATMTMGWAEGELEGAGGGNEVIL